MSKEAAVLFLEKMKTDDRFRAYIENLELDEQEKAVKDAGFDFSKEELALAIDEDFDFLENVSGGAASDMSDVYGDYGTVLVAQKTRYAE